MAPLTAEVLQAAIVRKEHRLAKYLQRYSEVWLLIAAAGVAPSQFFDVDALKEPSSVQSKFNRTYFIESFSGTVVRLGVQ